MIITKKIIILIALVALFCPFVNARAAEGDYQPLAPLPGTVTTEGGKATTDLGTYLPGIFRLLIALAGVLAIVMIVIGGVQYMSTDAIFGKSEGRNRITQALYGLIIILISYLLLQTINADLLSFKSINQIPKDGKGKPTAGQYCFDYKNNDTSVAGSEYYCAASAELCGKGMEGIRNLMVPRYTILNNCGGSSDILLTYMSNFGNTQNVEEHYTDMQACINRSNSLESQNVTQYTITTACTLR